jgi:hypothetical protein
VSRKVIGMCTVAGWIGWLVWDVKWLDDCEGALYLWLPTLPS